MATSNLLDPDRSIWHFIAVELRRQREARGLSQNKLAGEIGSDRSYVSRVESGGLHLSDRYAAKIDALWDTGGQFRRLVGLAEASDDGDWFTGLTEHESRATRHRMWEALLVPGLFQTPDYARAALEVGVVPSVEEALKKRLARQQSVFDRPTPPQCSVILSWVALAQPVGTDAVMREQIAHLLELSERPHINVRILGREARAHVGLDGSFRLMTVDDRDIAFADAPGRGRLITDAAGVQGFAVRYDRISDTAEPIGATRAVLERAMETYT